jgi:hypothetical protein
MLIACGIWVLLCPQFGGTGKWLSKYSVFSTNCYSFLVKDAQEDMAGERLKQ